ncbi:MAG: hypothetical protein ETSY1_37290 [Candidatus Entotheonella factor]|uniref:Uncharacterized protein n=1 Tax=Entotheonella factor TaxID=1429438 RepID=W4L739_ENTF1|nr:MAG: hypothetical protein ETSY1_37290 [Candidatus Entotheonella factor]
MWPRLDTCLILSVLITILASGGLAFADNAQRMAEMQKSLNAEVLDQPFSVAEPMEAPVAVEPSQQQKPVTRCGERCGRSYTYPRLSLGWYYGHHSHGFGHYYGHRYHRYHRHHRHY